MNRPLPPMLQPPSNGTRLTLILLRWALNALAVMLLPSLLDSVQVTGFLPALIAALIIGLLNALLRPILILLTLPVTVLSLGLFALVINALLFWAATGLVPGVTVAGFWSAFWAALLYSILSALVDLATGKPQARAGIQLRFPKR